MGKVVEKIKLTSFLDSAKNAEVEAVVDRGATMLALPRELIDGLNLRKIRDAKVRYANNKVESKGIYGVVSLELKGRVGVFEALAEVSGSQPLIGQIVLEALDFLVDAKSRRLIPNPASPDVPMVELL